MKKYTIDCGVSTVYLYTPYNYKKRFYPLANTCFGLRKSIVDCRLLKVEDVECNDFERLEFNGDIYVWDKEGRRKMIKPFEEEEWDDDCIGECKYNEESVDKSTPKKVHNFFLDGNKVPHTYKCPCCNEIIKRYNGQKYCMFCGQALDWSE